MLTGNAVAAEEALRVIDKQSRRANTGVSVLVEPIYNDSLVVLTR